MARSASGKQADALAKHQKGDLVSVSGQLQINQWTGQDGSTHSGYAMVADSVISARTVRPGGGRSQQKSGPPAQAAKQQTAGPQDVDPFPDDIPF
ncbi:single-stranded DNA-binding protein [Salmonella enterica subsp. enterica serovar Muenchen]|nr:single-stranded DNA-binding protein [Salmonella enterica subsp. enterica serovar Muenchen]